MNKSELKDSTSLSTDPLKADFRNFLWVVWHHLGFDPTPIQYDIAKYLQHGPKRLIIEAYRGVGKSWITAAFVCWVLYCEPNAKVLIVSASKSRADSFTTFILRLIREIPVLQHLSPGRDSRESRVAFDVAPAAADDSPSVKSVGITGQITGSRADYIIADDVEVATNSDTQTKRDYLSELVKEFDAVLKPGGRIIYLGTPQSEQTIYNTLAERGYVIRIWPARYSDKAQRNRYGTRLAPTIANSLDENPALVGQPTDPGRFSDQDLTERALSYGRSGFALQFQLDTSIADGERYPLRLSDLIVHPLDPYRAPIDMMWAASSEQALDLPAVGQPGDRYYMAGWVSPTAAEYEGSVMFIDPSGRGKDETAYAIVKQLHGRLFCIAAGGFLGGYDDETLERLLRIAKKHDVKRILTEPNFGGGMFSRLLQSAAQRIYPCSVEDAPWARTQKEARIIDTLEPVLNQHRLVVCPSVIEQDYQSTLEYESMGDRAVQEYRLAYQLTRLTRERNSLAHDDRLDALAGAVGYWVEVLARDTQDAAIAHKEALMDAELERFLKFALGPKRQTQQRWASSTLKKRRV